MNLPVMSVLAANTVNEKLKGVGIPPIDKVVIAISDKEETTSSGLILPRGDKDGVPKRATLVQVGPLSEEYQYLTDWLQIGMIITYGNYAGKEISPSKIKLDGFELKVISLNEIAYYEFNQ